MILQTIKCSVKGCKVEHTEEHFNQGFPRWGSVHGITDPETMEETAHVCPNHKKDIMSILNGGDSHDMG